MQRLATVLLSFAILLIILPAQAGQSTNDKIRQLIEMDGGRPPLSGPV